MIGDVYYGDTVYYHDRRFNVAAFENYQRGSYKCVLIKSLLDKIPIKLGMISTSDSVPLSNLDIECIRHNNAHAKDMEAAAVAEVAQLMNVPFMAIKAITDIVDSEENTYEQFMQSYRHAVEI